jgi:general secretion pathway protein B
LRVGSRPGALAATIGAFSVVAAGGGAGLTAATLAWLWFGQNESAPAAVAAPTPTPTPSPQPNPMPMPMPMAPSPLPQAVAPPPVTLPVTPAPVAPQAPVAAVKPAPPPAATTLKAPMVAASAPGRLPTRNELPSELRAALPPIAISGAVYAPAAKDRLLFANGLVLKEGDALADGLTVERIGASASVLMFRGQRFELKH